MPEPARTIALSVKLDDALTDLAKRTGDTRDDLLAKAIGWLLEDDRDYVASVEAGLADVAAGRTFSVEDVKRHLEETIARTALKTRA